MTIFYIKFLSKAGKRFLIPLFVLLFVSLGFAQQSNAQLDQVLNELVQNKSLTSQDATYLITSEHTSSTTGTHHVFYTQVIGGIPVIGTESSIHISSSGKVVLHNNKLVNNISGQIKNGRTPSLNPLAAIESVSQKMNYKKRSTISLVETKDADAQSFVYNTGGISRVNIPVRLAYQYHGKEGVSLVWELSIDDLNKHEDWYTFRVDATSGEILNKFNLIANCNLPHDHGNDFIGPKPKPIVKEIDKTATTALAPNDYNVYAWPVESPNYGSRSIQNSPWLDGSGSPSGWHDTNGPAAGGTSTLTTGNNVDAFDFNTNSRPDGGATLDFNFALNIAADPETYEDAAITNMFYWNNILHDITYEYGFDEGAGNFQESNYITGSGSGSDSVIGEGQKTGVCNAFFGTPSDGNNPTMQMFICDYALDRDGDLDNGVIAHEFGHGVSNRLVGGRFNVSCLNNSEQMGEGWSDVLGYLLTIESGDAGDDARGIGTWLVNQGATGPGIRQYRYTTNMGTNPHTYADVGSVVAPHGVGSVWAAMIWEMTWGLIADHGFDADVYNFTGTAADAGNIRALALVIEGLNQTACSPTFIDGRDAILAADITLYGGANQCIIWTAFAKRGLGLNASTGSNSQGDEVEDFTGPIPAFTVSADSFCSTEGSQNLSGATALNAGTYSGPGVTASYPDGTFDFDPAIAGIGVHTIVFTTTDCDGAPAAPSDTITVTDGDPVLICMDVTLTLDGGGNAILTNPDVIGNLIPGTGFTIDQSGTFAPDDITAVDTVVVLGDDAGTSAPVGFTFDFFGNSYTTIYIASNGYLSFTNAGLGEWQNTALGNGAAPNNMIAPMWDDLTPDGTSTISYATIGTAPNRVFVVNYDNIRHYTGGGTGLQNTFQVKLFEGSGIIEMHNTNITSDGGTRTQGIENVIASEFYGVAGRDNAVWTATNDFVAFLPNTGGLADNCGNSVAISLSQSAFTCADLGDNIVTITADDGNGGVSTCDVTVTIEGSSSVFSGGSWDVTPTAGTAATFLENFDTASDGDVTACSCEIDALATVTVNAGGTINVLGNITVDGTLDIEHEGSVVQINDDAAVNNNGTINVRKTTPTLNNRDFMILGNPMTGTTRANTFPNAVIFRQHLTANFVPNLDVATSDPGMENWADDNGDNWINYSAGMTPGQGFLVIPQAAPTVPDGATYNFTHNSGTLNTGVINFAVGFITDQNSSANVVGNPYASAISADVFVADNNTMVSTLYFWEHITSPSASYDGYNNHNYDMGDISMYLAGSGGTAAANGGTAPTGFIASGQGFGFKAIASGTLEFNNGQRVIGNNDDYKSAPLTIYRDQIWLNVYNETNRLGSQMLVAFVEGATQDFEQHYDAKRLATPVSLFSTIGSGEQLTIQGREAFDIEDQIVIGFRSQIETNELFTISLDNIEKALMGDDVNVYLEDTVTGAIVNLSERDYSFNATASLQEDRFVMFFQEKVLGTDDNSLNELQLVPNPTSSLITVMTPSNTTVDYVQVVDIRGRVVAQKRFNGTDSYVIDMSNLGSAVYFVKIHSTEGTITKRVIKQ